MAWKEAAQPVMELYTESTDGSFIEAKESALVWHHRDADPDFGSWQVGAVTEVCRPVGAGHCRGTTRWVPGCLADCQGAGPTG